MDIIGKRKIWFILSGILIAISLISLLVQGLNLGIDFSGGTLIEFKFGEQVTTGDVRNILEEFDLKDSVIQKTANEGILIRTERLKHERIMEVQERIQQEYPEAELLRTSVVGPTIGQELQSKAIWAILFAALAIVAYISIRFQFRFAIAALGALGHDVLIVLGVFSLLGREINSPFIAALLTIVGYSINDTIVIFDRIREKIRLYRGRGDFAELNNEAVLETLPRSINTSVTTLLPVLAILFLGGSTLVTFMTALLVGMLSGTYSSIFVASPLLVEWNEHSKMKRKV